MTTAQFIELTYNTTATKDRHCSSVYTDHAGIVYSYGQHYPLAFHIDGLDFINTTGYSNTTAKHINWAYQAIGYGVAIPVELDRADAQVISSSWSTNGQKLDVIRDALHRQAQGIMTEMRTKRRQDTAVYAGLQRRLGQVQIAINKVGK